MARGQAAKSRALDPSRMQSRLQKKREELQKAAQPVQAVSGPAEEQKAAAETDKSAAGPDVKAEPAPQGTTARTVKPKAKAAPTPQTAKPEAEAEPAPQTAKSEAKAESVPKEAKPKSVPAPDVPPVSPVQPAAKPAKTGRRPGRPRREIERAAVTLRPNASTVNRLREYAAQGGYGMSDVVDVLVDLFLDSEVVAEQLASRKPAGRSR